MLAALKAGEMNEKIRTSLEWVLQQLIEAEATSVIGAGRYERSEGRLTQRNGYRPRLLSTPAGDVELGIPKFREGAFFLSLLERRRRIDRALCGVVMEAYVHGVSTRKVDDLVKALGAASEISKSEVSRVGGLVDAIPHRHRALIVFTAGMGLRQVAERVGPRTPEAAQDRSGPSLPDSWPRSKRARGRHFRVVISWADDETHILGYHARHAYGGNDSGGEECAHQWAPSTCGTKRHRHLGRGTDCQSREITNDLCL